jgi:Ni/Co efflux regulator RcnB
VKTAKSDTRGAFKRLSLVIAAGVALVGASAALAQPYQHHGGNSGWNHNGNGPSWSHGAATPPWQRSVPHSVSPGGYPNGRGPSPAGGWDQHRYNGYWVGGRWYYGQPQQPAYVAPGFRPGFTPWRRGAFLPPAYQSYVLDAYWRFHLRTPPYGYHWVQVGDEYLLVSASTGLIFDVVTGGQ